MMSFVHALIMAAGRGTRMLPLTDAMPKPMAPYKGSTLIAHGISKLVTKVPSIHITIGYKKAMLASHVIENGVASILNTEGQPNSWWIYHTLMSHLDEPVVVLTADNIAEMDFDELYAEYVALGQPICMLVPVKPVAGLEGDYIHHRDQIVYEVDRLKPADTYCSGIQVLNPKRIVQTVCEGESFYDVWRGLMALEALKASRKSPSKWFTIDTIEQLTAANNSAASNEN
jgi:NDP-sugar pyrophosphorylase family protein